MLYISEIYESLFVLSVYIHYQLFMLVFICFYTNIGPILDSSEDICVFFGAHFWGKRHLCTHTPYTSKQMLVIVYHHVSVLLLLFLISQLEINQWENEQLLSVYVKKKNKSILITTCRQLSDKISFFNPKNVRFFNSKLGRPADTNPII